MPPSPIKAPISAAHFSLLANGTAPEGGTNYIPEEVWSRLEYSSVDVLYISPFTVNNVSKLSTNPSPTGTFNLGPGVFPEVANPEDGPGGGASLPSLTDRLKWIVKFARQKNPGVKIFAQQSALKDYTDFASLAKLPSSLIDTYASSVRKMLESKDYDLDGYDLDFSGWNATASNVATILTKIRAQLDQSKIGRPLYVTITAPASGTLDKNIAKAVHFVNIMNAPTNTMLADNSTIVATRDFGFVEGQVLLGIRPDDTALKSLPTIDEVKSTYNKYTNKKLAGINVWGLNGSNITYTNETQVAVNKFLKGLK